MSVAWVGAGIAAVGVASQASSARGAADAQSSAAAQSDATQRYMYDTTREDNAPFRDVGVSANNRLAQLMGLGVKGRSTFDAAAYLRDNPDVAAQPFWAADPYAHYTQHGQQEGRPLPQGAAATDPNAADFGSLTRNFSAADLNADPVYQNGLQFGLSEGTKGINRIAAAGGSMLSGATLKALTKYGNDYGSTKANESYNRFNTNQDRTYNKLAGLSGAGQQATNQVSAAGQNMANNISQSQQGVGNARASGYIAQGNALVGGLTTGYNMYQNNQLMNQLGGMNNGGFSGYGTNYRTWDPVALNSGPQQ